MCIKSPLYTHTRTEHKVHTELKQQFVDPRVLAMWGLNYNNQDCEKRRGDYVSHYANRAINITDY